VLSWSIATRFARSGYSVILDEVGSSFGRAEITPGLADIVSPLFSTVLLTKDMAVRDWVRGLRGTLDRQTVYLKLENDDASAESVATLLDSTQSIKPHRAKYVFSIANALLFLSSIVLVVVAYTRPVTDSQCVRQLYTWCKS
jgi:hypothetical protein